MSLSRRGTATPKPTLTSIPYDIHLNILHFMHPTQIALYSQLCTLTQLPSLDPILWANIARRHLGLSSATTFTPASVSDLAQSLVSRWWLVTGAIVPGIPVHFRKGFAQIHSRGGQEILLDDSGDSAYVWGGKNTEHVVPTIMPGMEMDFYLDVAGPFPVEGVTVRILHAARDEEVEGEEMEESHALSKKPVEAKVRIRVNEEEEKEPCLVPSGRFEAFEFKVDAHALRTKPSMNRLFIQYDRNSTASYWIREVLIMPCVLPIPKVEESKLMFNQAMEVEGKGDRNVGRQYETNETNGNGNEMREAEDGGGDALANIIVRTPPRRASRNQETSPISSRETARSPSRRGSTLVELDIGKTFLSEPVFGKGKMQKSKRLVKTPKHMYHHNHYRSPRGNSRGGLGSPRSRGR